MPLLKDDFPQRALALFRRQAAENVLYRNWCQSLNCVPESVTALTDIPFLPITFFKTHEVVTGAWTAPAELVFTSSGTTGTVNSKHLVRDKKLYEQSLLQGFEQFYGPPADWTFLALLPSYLERGGSSLVYMAEVLMRESRQAGNGFFLHDFESLARELAAGEQAGRKTLLLGVTYALLDFAEAFPQPLQHTILMETGGMKGRKREILREEVHALLKSAFGVSEVHSEYGMTELLSQAYAPAAGIFFPSHTLRAFVADINDPLTVQVAGTGVLCFIDLSNEDSCAFIATEDLGRVEADGSFEVLGRMDHSALRGCSLLAL
jgi:phenylacetate-coenzyme A ligase PaaK-like adenylate-forming protein